MRHVQAPEQWARDGDDGPVIFLAGGITGCPLWQREVVDLCADQPVVLLNPRRDEAPDDAAGQIAWEHRMLWSPGLDVTLFWFPACDPAVTGCPIVLFELGGAIGAVRRLVVGADPAYPRRFDVVEQVRLGCGPTKQVHASLAATVAAALRAAGMAQFARVLGGRGRL